MARKHGWFCLRCKKFVDVGITRISLIGVTAQRTCKECGTTAVMKLGEMSDDEFAELAKKFKERTDRLGGASEKF